LLWIIQISGSFITVFSDFEILFEMKESKKSPNKDLILREQLALERTGMAIDRTFLSYLRTSLYFSIAGMSVDNLLKISYGQWMEILFWVVAIIILISGFVKMSQKRKKLKESEKYIGHYNPDWEDDFD
jgi:inner membrane protein YidH